MTNEKEQTQDMLNISDYFKKYNTIQEELKIKKNENFKSLKIALLLSSTTKGLKEIIFVKCYNLGIIADIFISDYNQYNQDILDQNSDFYKFEPDLVILGIDIKTLLGDTFFSYYELKRDDKNKLLENNINQIKLLIKKIKETLKCKVILHNLEIPTYSPLGIIDNKQDLGFINFVKKLNFELEKIFQNDNQIFIFDYDAFCSKLGKNNLIDYKMYYLGDIRINLNYLPLLCEEYISYIKPLMGLTKKCIVLDLDNTLWGGIIGEDGIEGIKLGPTPAGRPFLEFQNYILSLFNRGVILAINSKNNPEDALNVLKNHPYMILKEKHFASIQINWSDKVSNMEAIAKEINIGLDSLVFFDDDKLNREMVRSSLPEVKVIELPEDPCLYLKTLTDLNDFNILHFSEEDKMKGKMYADQKKRLDLSNTITDISEYLKALNMVVTIENAKPFTIPRISQLTQKTNQFNITTRRYLEEDIKRFSSSNDTLIFSIRVEDKFGDNGITGVAIVQKKNDKWIIDSFLLSCRILGRRLEEIMLGYILEKAKEHNIKKLIGEFIPTNKNVPSKDFYKKNGFKFIEEKDGSEIWEYPVEIEYEVPDFIKVIKNNKD